MNLYRTFQELLPKESRGIGTVISVNSSAGTSTLQTLSGGTVVVMGVSVAIGKKAYHKAGRIEGEAPDLPTYEIVV